MNFPFIKKGWPIINTSYLEFGDGECKGKLVTTAEKMMVMLAILDDTHATIKPNEDPIGYIFQTVWHRIQQVCKLGPLKVASLPRVDSRILLKINRWYYPQRRPSTGEDYSFLYPLLWASVTLGTTSFVGS